MNDAVSKLLQVHANGQLINEEENSPSMLKIARVKSFDKQKKTLD